MSRPKAKFSASIDADLWDEIRSIAEARGEVVSSTVDRMLAGALPGEKAFLRAMDSPVGRVLLKAAGNPALQGAVALMAAERISEEELKQIKAEVDRQADRGAQRTRGKEGGKRKKRGSTDAT